MYGWRARIGLIVPSSNTTMESEFWRMAPEGVSIHTSRIRLVEVTAEALKRMAEESVRAARELADAEVDVIVYGCTMGSLIEGVEWEMKLRESIEKSVGVKTITTAQAVVKALKKLGAKRIVVATPYIEDLNRREKKFLEDNGFEVLRIKGLNIVKNTDIGRLPPWTTYRLAKEVFSEDADAVFISCTNFRTIDVIATLEQELGKPAISSNTASFWYALRALRLNIPIKGFGRLLEMV